MRGKKAERKHKRGKRLLSLLIIAVFYVLSDFLRLRFEVADGTVSWGFGVFAKCFPLAAVQSCEPYEITFWNYLGFGVRFGIMDGTIGYINRLGTGVKLEIEGKRRPYVISVKDPLDICELLNH